MNHNHNPSVPFPWFTAIIGYSLAGILLQASWLLGITFFYGVTAPWTDWLFKAVAGGVAGWTTALVLERKLLLPPNTLRVRLKCRWLDDCLGCDAPGAFQPVGKRVECGGYYHDHQHR